MIFKFGFVLLFISLFNLFSKDNDCKIYQSVNNQIYENIEFQELPSNSFAKIDEYVKKCPNSIKNDFNKISIYLNKICVTDLEKARAIYIWLIYNIDYDDYGFNYKKIRDCSADSVLRSKKTVCEGFSNLYLAFGLSLKLDIKKVHGYAKGYGYNSKDKFRDTDHAWNIIKINNNWRIFDATWGQSYGINNNGKLVSVKKIDNYWFNLDPYESIFNHLPKDTSFQFVKPYLSLSVYERIQNIDFEYFKLGFNAEETYQAIIKNNNLIFPNCYDVGINVKIINAPKYKTVFIGDTCNFEIYAPECIELSAIEEKSKNEDWIQFEKQNKVFKLTYIPKSFCNLKISARTKKSGESHNILMEYFIRKKISLAR